MINECKIYICAIRLNFQFSESIIHDLGKMVKVFGM